MVMAQTARWTLALGRSGVARAETNMGANATVHMHALTKHHESCAHHRSLTTLLGRAPPDVAPLAELFSEVLRQLQNGLDLSGGFATLVGRVTAEKVKAMVWCLSEASLQMKAEVCCGSNVHSNFPGQAAWPSPLQIPMREQRLVFLVLRVHWAVSRSHSGFDWHQPRNKTDL